MIDNELVWEVATTRAQVLSMAIDGLLERHLES